MNQGNQNIFVTSHNQSGGITANTVNFGPQARQMNDQLGQQLKQNVPIAAKVTVTAVLGDGEAFAFANQVLQWLRSNSYQSVEGVNQAIYSVPVKGNNLEVKPNNEFDIIIGTNA